MGYEPAMRPLYTHRAAQISISWLRFEHIKAAFVPASRTHTTECAATVITETQKSKAIHVTGRGGPYVCFR
jgi:hypothetical protein